MRILLVSHRFPPTGVAGVERITQSLAAAFARYGDVVNVFTRAARSPAGTRDLLEMESEYLTDGTCVYRLTGTHKGIGHFLAHHELIERYYNRVLVETAPDVVHFLHLQDLSPRLPEITYRHGAAVVYSLQDFYYACALVHLLKPNGDLCEGPRGGRECAETCFAEEGARALSRWGMRTLYWRRILELGQQLIAPSHYVADFFQRYGVASERIPVIPNAVFFPIPNPRTSDRPTPGERGRLHLAFVGSVIPHKGLHILFRALRLAQLGPVKVLILGRMHGAEYVTGLKHDAVMIPELEVDWHGEYEPAELPRLLADSDCLVMPSLIRETFGIVIDEALALGIPALISNTGAQSERIREGVNGFTFDVNHPAALGALLYRLAHEHELIPKMRMGAAQTPVMSADEHARAVRSVYETALGERALPQFARAVDVDERNWLVSELVREGFATPGPAM